MPIKYNFIWTINWIVKIYLVDCFSSFLENIIKVLFGKVFVKEKGKLCWKSMNRAEMLMNKFVQYSFKTFLKAISNLEYLSSSLTKTLSWTCKTILRPDIENNSGLATFCQIKTNIFCLSPISKNIFAKQSRFEPVSRTTANCQQQFLKKSFAIKNWFKVTHQIYAENIYKC